MGDDFWKPFGVISAICATAYAAIGLLLKWLVDKGALTQGWATAVVLALLALGFWGFFLLHRFYGLLAAGDAAPGTQAREDYDALRARLAAGGTPAQIYVSLLARALDRVDGFFDPVEPNGTRSTPPTWTARSYDQCLLLAFLYPLLVMTIVWVGTGHVGMAESALGFKVAQPWFLRLAGGLALFALFAFCAHRTATTLGDLLTVAMVCGSTVLAAAFFGAGAGFFFFIVALISAITAFFSEPRSFFVFVASSFFLQVALMFACFCMVFFIFIFGLVLYLAFGLALEFAKSGAYTNAIAATGAGAVVAVLVSIFVYIFINNFIAIVNNSINSIEFNNTLAARHLIFTILTLILLFSAPLLFDAASNEFIGAMTLFFGVLTLVNAPFDWFCLGLTRYLLRQGLSLQASRLTSFSPVLFGALDAVASTLILFLLAAAILLSIQIFNATSLVGGGVTVFDLDGFMRTLGDSPLEPSNFWAYALLATTILPSLLNLAIGFSALFRGLPGVSEALAAKMPLGAPPAPHNRLWLSMAMTLQTLFGALLGLAAQMALFYFVFWIALPFFEINAFDEAKTLVDADWPVRIANHLILSR